MKKNAYRIQATMHAYITVDAVDEEDAIERADLASACDWSDPSILSLTVVDINPADDYEDAPRDQDYG